MPHYNEFFFVPGEYKALGDKLIESPPLICTSLQELAELGWCLNIRHNFVRGYGYSKLRFHFYDPDQNGNPYLTFKMWKRGTVISLDRLHAAPEKQEAENKHTLLSILFKEELKFSLTKQPVFTVLSQQESPEKKEVIKYVIRDETELEFLQKMNEQRLESLRRNQDTGDAKLLSDSQERLVG